MLADIAAFVAYGVLTSGIWALIFTPVAAISGIAGPALGALLSNATPDDQQGELQGILTTLTAIAMGISPFLMTQVFAVFTRDIATTFLPGAPFLLSAVLIGACVYLFLVKRR